MFSHSKKLFPRSVRTSHVIVTLYVAFGCDLNSVSDVANDRKATMSTFLVEVRPIPFIFRYLT